MLATMIESATEFAFVSEVTRSRSSPKVWAALEQLRALIKNYGVYVPMGLAQRLLGVSNQRIHQLIGEGVLVANVVDGHKFLTEESVVAYAQSERKAGRPVKAPEGIKELTVVTREWVKDCKKNSYK